MQPDRAPDNNHEHTDQEPLDKLAKPIIHHDSSHTANSFLKIRAISSAIYPKYQSKPL